MAFGIGILVAVFILYKLLINGALWKMIVAFFGFFGMEEFLSHSFPSLESTCILLGDYGVSWAVTIPLGIIIMAMIYTGK
jgi:hypothetical protein